MHVRYEKGLSFQIHLYFTQLKLIDSKRVNIIVVILLNSQFRFFDSLFAKFAFLNTHVLVDIGFSSDFAHVFIKFE